MVWTVLIAHAPRFDPALLNVAFVFLLLGYGTKVGLAPLHAWLPDAHAEGPTPISAVLSGLLLNVALYAVLRFKMLLAANAAAIAPGPLMVTMGLVSLIFAAFMLYRRRDIKRLFAYSSIEHMGIIAFAFGMGGPLANFAGLLHMTMHSLTKSAIFFAVGHIAQVKGTQRIADIRGLTETHPVLGWGLVLGVVAIAGLPPLGIFMSEFLVVSSTFARAAAAGDGRWCSACWSRSARCCCACNGLAFGEPRGSTAPVKASYVPMFAHLALGAGARASICRRRWSSGSRTSRGCWDDAMSALADLIDRRRSAVAAHRPWPRVIVDAEAWRCRAASLRRWQLTLARPLGRSAARCTWRCCDDGAAQIAVLEPRLSRRALSRRSAALHPPAIRLERAIRDLFGLEPEGAPTRGPGSITAAGASPAARRSQAGDAAPYAFLPAEGESLHQIPVGPVHAGIIEPGHFRFTANGETVVRLEERLGYVAQGHRGADGGRRSRARREARGPRLGRQHGRLCLRLRARGRGGARRRRRRRARIGCAR